MRATELDRPQFPMTVAATAAGLAINTLRVWWHRGYIVAGKRGERVPERVASGRFQLLSLRRVFQIAITRELVSRDLSPDDAARAALAFTDIGGPSGNKGALVSDGPQADDDDLRFPGELFRGDDNPLTFLVVRIDDAGKPRASVELLRRNMPISRLLDGGSRIAAIVDVGEIVETVRARLALPPDDNRRGSDR